MKKYKSIILSLSMLVIFFSSNINIVNAEETNQTLPSSNTTTQSNQKAASNTQNSTKNINEKKETQKTTSSNNNTEKKEAAVSQPSESTTSAPSENKTESTPQKKQTKPTKKTTLGATEPQPLSLDALYSIAGTLSNETVSSNQNSQTISEPKESHSVPSDLPEVESSDIVLPQMTASNENKDKNDLIPGIVAWSFIAIGIAIIIFVLIKGSRQNNKDISLNNSSNKKKKNKSRLLSDKYYKN